MIEAEDGDKDKKKYVNLKLIDLEVEAMHFWHCYFSNMIDPAVDGIKPEKLYKGGSRGTFEHLTMVKDGNVIALLNSNDLKLFQVCPT